MESKFKNLVKISEHLRGPNGCPWDKEQTRESLKKYLLEETYEVLEALDDKKNPKKLAEELGDLLYQILFHANIGKEKDEFTIEDIIDSLTSKLVRRHPHVFIGKKTDCPKKAHENWTKMKKKEGKSSILSGVPKTLPALLKAFRLCEKASHVGFDWEKVEDILEKFKEEVSEFGHEYKKGDKNKIKDELGDILFVITNIARKLNIDPEDALNRTNKKFIQRFQYIEKEIEKSGKNIKDVSLDQMEELWEKAKAKN